MKEIKWGKKGMGLLLAGGLVWSGCGQGVKNPVAPFVEIESGGSGGSQAPMAPSPIIDTVILHPTNGQSIVGMSLYCDGVTIADLGIQIVQVKLDNLTAGLGWDGNAWQTTSGQWFKPAGWFVGSPSSHWAESVVRPMVGLTNMECVLQARGIDLSGHVERSAAVVRFHWE